jgi:hypothetical protein
MRSSEIQYLRLFEAASVGRLILSPGMGKVTDANPFMTQSLACSHEELLDKEFGITRWPTPSQGSPEAQASALDDQP